MNRSRVADLILTIQPEMRELVHLQEEVVRLRCKMAPPTPTLATLMEGLPITVKQDDDGRWSSTIDLGPECAKTGVTGCETDVEVFRASVRHLATLLGREWSREDDD